MIMKDFNGKDLGKNNIIKERRQFVKGILHNRRLIKNLEWK